MWRRVVPIVCTALMILFAGCGGGGSSAHIAARFSEGSSGFYYSPPSIRDDAIYIGTSRKYALAPATDNYFFKLTLDLEEIWRYELGTTEVRGAAAIDESGRAFFVTGAGRAASDDSNLTLALVALDTDGALLWTKPLTIADAELGMFTPAIAADGTVIVGTAELIAVDPDDGSTLWSYGANATITNAPIIDPEGNIYLALAEAETVRIVSLTAAGAERWSFTPTDQRSQRALSSPAFSFDHTRVYAAAGITMHCLQASDGTLLWSYAPASAQGEFRATPAVDAEGNAYVGTKANADSVLYAFAADGSGLLWENAVGADLYSSPLLGDAGRLYVGSERTDRGHFHAIELADGAFAWSVDLAADITWSSAAIGTGGGIFIGAMDNPDAGLGGTLFRFAGEATGFLVNAGSPRFHEGNASTGRRGE